MLRRFHDGIVKMICISDQAQELIGQFANLLIKYSIQFFGRTWIFSANMCQMVNALEEGRGINSLELSSFFYTLMHTIA
jgi:hypothetical protein